MIVELRNVEKKMFMELRNVEKEMVVERKNEQNFFKKPKTDSLSSPKQLSIDNGVLKNKYVNLPAIL